MPHLRVRLLGDLQIDGCDPALLGRRQLRTLLKILALHHGRPVSTDRLVEYLWSDSPPNSATDQVSVLVSRLRNALGNERIQRSDAGYTLSLDWLDVDALDDYATESELRLAQGATGACRTAASAGLSLVRGPLLADEADPWWATAERSACEELVNRLRHTAAAATMAAGDWVEVIALARNMMDTDPYDEVALRFLMESLSRSGRTASALAEYASTRERLAEDLGIDPSPETEDLHTALLLGEGPTASVTREAPAMSELPGRVEALTELHGYLDVASHGSAQTVIVEGEAGIGKSRLLEVWSSQVESRGIQVVRIECTEIGRDLPLQPLFDVITELVRLFAAGEPTAVLGPEGSVLGPMIGFQPGPTGPASLAALTDPDAGQLLLLGAITGVLRRWAADEVRVLVLDDVQEADPATLRWLAQAARRLADNRILIVAARRLEDRSSLPGVGTITLGPLDISAVSAVVGQDRATDLLERSGGNPLFLTELATAHEGDELPESIRHSVEQRCLRAGAAGVTFRTAAVIGPEIDLDLLASVTDTRPGELLDHLEMGVQRRFLVEEGANFRFIHALIREALAASVGASRSAFIHRSVARTLGTRLDFDPLEVARHARLGGDLAEASAMLVVAARTAVIRFDQEGAMRLLDDAISLSDSPEARLERARLHSMAARHESADADVAAARALGAGPEALEVAAWSAHFERRFEDALRLADQGAREAVNDDVRTSCLALGGWVSLASGDLLGAQQRLEGAIGVTLVASGRMAESWLAWLRAYQGRPEETLQLATQEHGKGLAAYRFPNAYGLMASVMSLAMLGRAEDALTTNAVLKSEIERMGAPRWTPRPLNLEGWILRNLGESTKADELNHAALESAQSIGQAEPLANALLDLAAGRLLDHDLDAAEQLLDRAAMQLEVEHAFRWRHELRGRLLRSRLLLEGGDMETALGVARELTADTAAQGIPRYEVQSSLLVAMAEHRLGLEVSLNDVEAHLQFLGGVAGLESWWITADVAREFGEVRWTALAQSRVAQLHRHVRSFRRSARALRRTTTRLTSDPPGDHHHARAPSPNQRSSRLSGFPHDDSSDTSIQSGEPRRDVGQRESVRHENIRILDPGGGPNDLGVDMEQSSVCRGSRERGG